MNSFTDNFKDSDQKLKIYIQNIFDPIFGGGGEGGVVIYPPLPAQCNNFFSTIAMNLKVCSF